MDQEHTLASSYYDSDSSCVSFNFLGLRKRYVHFVVVVDKVLHHLFNISERKVNIVSSRCITTMLFPLPLRGVFQGLFRSDSFGCRPRLCSCLLSCLRGVDQPTRVYFDLFGQSSKLVVFFTRVGFAAEFNESKHEWNRWFSKKKKQKENYPPKKTHSGTQLLKK